MVIEKNDLLAGGCSIGAGNTPFAAHTASWSHALQQEHKYASCRKLQTDGAYITFLFPISARLLQ